MCNGKKQRCSMDFRRLIMRCWDCLYAAGVREDCGTPPDLPALFSECVRRCEGDEKMANDILNFLSINDEIAGRVAAAVLEVEYKPLGLERPQLPERMVHLLPVPDWLTEEQRARLLLVKSCKLKGSEAFKAVAEAVRETRQRYSRKLQTALKNHEPGCDWRLEAHYMDKGYSYVVRSDD